MSYIQKFRFCKTFLPVLFLLSMCLAASEQVSEYNPLEISEEFKPEIIDLNVIDSNRSREIPLRIYLPQKDSPAAVVLFSHGLGGSCKNNSYLGKHWSGRGFAAVFMQHLGSDVWVWKDVPLRKRLAAMKKAANAKNYLLRVNDVPVVIDQLIKWNIAEEHQLKNRLDISKIGMSGHSFGARTTQAVSGQGTGFPGISFTDKRIKAAVIFSPSVAKRVKPEKIFSTVEIPWMLMTGTKDVAIIGQADLKARLGVFPALPPGSKYEVVFYNAEHSAFTERRLRGDSEPRNPNHHRAILALSTAFWESYLEDSRNARKWLDGAGAKSVLEKRDRWQKK